MRAIAWLAFALVAGCSQPGPNDVSFAATLGEPGCNLRHPDGSDAPCRTAGDTVTPSAEPPAGWACVNDAVGPGFRYAVYRFLATGESGVWFEDGNFGDAPSGLILDSTRPGAVVRWNGTATGFVPLGTALGAQDEVKVFVYDLKVVAAEGEAVHASVRERWSEHGGFPWLSYQVTFEAQTYHVSGMSSAGQPINLDASNAAGRLATRLDWNGGWRMTGGDAPNCAT